VRPAALEERLSLVDDVVAAGELKSLREVEAEAEKSGRAMRE
jgi:hypothetical protein